METKDSAVQLLKEWKQLSDSIMGPHGLINHVVELARISRRLDEKAEAAGITIEAGVEYAHDSFVYVRVFQGRAMNLEFSEPYKKYGTLPAREQQAIQEWLLIKNEEKTA